MKRILLTGGAGFVGRNILSGLRKRPDYEVYAPTRYQLNTKNTLDVEQLLQSGKFDIVILADIPTPKHNSQQLEDDIYGSCMLSFMNFYRMRGLVEKIIYFGSGAEFDKRRDIRLVSEEMWEYCQPADPYGLAKRQMNKLARSSDNIYNLRLFGCYGPSDAKRKFIAHCIECCIQKVPITIRQDCVFDYLYVEDLIPIIFYILESSPCFHDYNTCSGFPQSLLQIAEIVKRKMGRSDEILILSDEQGKEYTGSNSRLKREFPSHNFTSLENGIQLQINYELEHAEIN